jgi:hypothetical protein
MDGIPKKSLQCLVKSKLQDHRLFIQETHAIGYNGIVLNFRANYSVRFADFAAYSWANLAHEAAMAPATIAKTMEAINMPVSTALTMK